MGRSQLRSSDQNPSIVLRGPSRIGPELGHKPSSLLDNRNIRTREDGYPHGRTPKRISLKKTGRL